MPANGCVYRSLPASSGSWAASRLTSDGGRVALVYSAKFNNPLASLSACVIKSSITPGVKNSQQLDRFHWYKHTNRTKKNTFEGIFIENYVIDVYYNYCDNIFILRLLNYFSYICYKFQLDIPTINDWAKLLLQCWVLSYGFFKFVIKCIIYIIQFHKYIGFTVQIQHYCIQIYEPIKYNYFSIKYNFDLFNVNLKPFKNN